MPNLLPPANEVCKGYVFTRICLSTGRGGVPGQVRPPSRYIPRQVHPLSRYTPQSGTPPWAGTPPSGQVHPLPGRYTPLQAGTPPSRQIHPLGRYPPPQCMLGYGQQAGGTHPTGMHSCFYYHCINKESSAVSVSVCLGSSTGFVQCEQTIVFY